MSIYVEVSRMFDLEFLFGDSYNPEDHSDLESFIDCVVEDVNLYLNKNNSEGQEEIELTSDDLSIKFADWDDDLNYFVNRDEIDEGLWEFLDLDSNEQEMFNDFVSHFGWQSDYDSTFRAAEEANTGKWDSENDFAWHIFEECYSDMYKLMDSMNWLSYFDDEQWAYDLFIGDYVRGNNGWVFSRNW